MISCDPTPVRPEERHAVSRLEGRPTPVRPAAVRPEEARFLRRLEGCLAHPAPVRPEERYVV